MTRSYEALNGIEAAKAIAKKATELALSIPGMNSRMVVFPRLKVTITVKVEAFDRPDAEVTDVDDLIDKEFADVLGNLVSLGEQEFVARVDEMTSSPDGIRKQTGIPVTKPTLDPTTGQITDKAADPLPAGDNLDNIQQFGRPGGAVLADGTQYSGRGRVIENETVGLTGASPVGPKLKGDPGATHFRVRNS